MQGGLKGGKKGRKKVVKEAKGGIEAEEEERRETGGAGIVVEQWEKQALSVFAGIKKKPDRELLIKNISGLQGAAETSAHYMTRATHLVVQHENSERTEKYACLLIKQVRAVYVPAVEMGM